MTITNAEQPDLGESGVEIEDLGRFCQSFQGWMQLYAPVPVVKDYLDVHRGWFLRCAQPMKAEPLGDMGYVLGIGRLGAFRFYVEPKIGLQLLPQNEGGYRIESVPVPGYEPKIYAVAFQSSLQILENSRQEIAEIPESPASGVACNLVWELDLSVWVQFPGFIRAMPPSLIRKTGDRVLVQVVKQVSRRLTRKVQEDFHQSQGIPFPPKTVKAEQLWHFSPVGQQISV